MTPYQHRQRPRSPNDDRRRNILVLADYDPGNANVIADFLYSFDRYSRHRYYYAIWPRFLEPSFDFGVFDVIVIFWSIYFPPPPGVPPSLPPGLVDKLRKCSALKVLFRQDEHVFVHQLHAAIDEVGINVMFTCVAERDHEHFYPQGKLPTLKGVHSVLTGYVPRYLESPALLRDRRVMWDIGYRSRAVPYALGDLGREKVGICHHFAELGPRQGLTVNLSVREQDRLYGRAWLRFLRSTRFQLGTPSGASVIDFTGEIAGAVTRFLAKHPAASYDEVRRRYFANVDGQLVIDTISPRLFEYSATGNVMVLHEGYYGGLLEPDVHFIPVRKDYSNIGDVFAKMRDAGYCERLRKAAYQHLIASRQFSYTLFAKRFDGVLDNYLPKLAVSYPTSRIAFYRARVIRSKQTVVSIRGREIVLPVRGGLRHWRRTLVDGLTRRIPFLGPAIRRRGGSAFAHLRRGLLVFGAVLASAPLRRALWYCCSRSELRRNIHLYDLLRELGCLLPIQHALVARRPVTFFVPQLSPEGSLLRLCQLRTEVRPLTFARVKRGAFRRTLAQIAVSAATGQPTKVRLELAKREYGLRVPVFVAAMYFTRDCPEGIELRQFSLLLQSERAQVAAILQELFEVRPRSAIGRSVDRFIQLSQEVLRKSKTTFDRLSMLSRLIVSPHGVSQLFAYVFNSRIRRRVGFRGYVRELWLWLGLSQVQKAQAYVPEPFWVEAKLEGAVLRFTSHRGISAGGTVEQRRVIESAWAQARHGGIDRVEWDHRALGKVFAWQLPGRPWQGVRLGEEGLQELRGVVSCDSWWKSTISDSVHPGAAGAAVAAGREARESSHVNVSHNRSRSVGAAAARGSGSSDTGSGGVEVLRAGAVAVVGIEAGADGADRHARARG
jgi:hypothetical protein